MRLFIFESHPVQYHAPVYRRLHKLCLERHSGSVQVVYGTDVSLRGHFDEGFKERLAWDEPLMEGYPATVLNTENGVPLRGFNSLTGKGVWQLLRRERPDGVMLTGLRYRFDWTAYWSAVRLRIPLWIRTETQDEAFTRGRLKSLARSWFYRLAYRRIQTALVIGRLNADHYKNHGLRAARHIRSPYCVVDRFQQFMPQEAAACRAQIRAKAGFGSEKVLLFSGKLQPKKYPDALLDALASMPANERTGFGVLYVGSGELEPLLRQKARNLPEVKVCFAGFKNQTEIAPYYLASELLILPSRQMGETWGLVVNEALLAERRVIISRFAGCHADFMEAPGVTVFDGSVKGLVEALRQPSPIAPQGAQLAFMRRYSVTAAAEGIATAMGIRSYPGLSGTQRRYPSLWVVRETSRQAGACHSPKTDQLLPDKSPA